MKDMKDCINESKSYYAYGFNPSLAEHEKAYNDLCKWYKKHNYSMNDEEIEDCLQTFIANGFK